MPSHHTWVARGSRMSTCATSFSGMFRASAISVREGVEEPKLTLPLLKLLLLPHCTLALSCNESSCWFWCSAR